MSSRTVRHSSSLVLGCALVMQAYAQVKEPPLSSNADFLRTAAEHWDALDRRSIKPVDFSRAAKHRVYLPLASLIRGQDEISVDNIGAKFAEKKGLKDLAWDESHARWTFAFNGGTSSTSLEDPIQVIKGPQGYVIVDGHHDVFLSLYLGATQAASEVKEDLSQLSPEKFWETMRDRNLVYLKEDIATFAKHPPQMGIVHDNPNRYLASLMALKVSGDPSAHSAAPLKIKGPKVPVWVKLNDSVPFIEFTIADILAQAGIVYPP